MSRAFWIVLGVGLYIIVLGWLIAAAGCSTTNPC